ncbi:MAG TPA: glycosyl hydrolase-related protein, partial [Pyrinomonadaceae bacterium]
YASDKPDDNTLRLTLLYTPGLGEGNGKDYHDQTTQDLGHHEFVYGLAGHQGDWRREQTDWQAQRLNQPLIAFQSSQHRGTLGTSFSMLAVNNSRVRVLAFKRAEESDEMIVRLVELDGRPARNVRIRLAGPIASAREVNGQEQPIGAATIARGELVTDLGPYQLRSFALRLAPSRKNLGVPQSLPVELPYDLSASSLHDTKTAGGFDSAGRSLPAEMLPGEVSYAGIRFRLAPAGVGQPNALRAAGQTINLPPGNFKRLYILAASVDDDQRAAFRVGERSVELTIQNWGGFIGQWDNRQWTEKEVTIPPANPVDPAAPRTRIDPYAEMTGIRPGFIKPAPLAWFASHHHNTGGRSEPYAYSYLFAYAIDLPLGAKTLTLPRNDRIRVMAVTVSDEGEQFRAARPLYDTLERDTK